jgi:hypothetical protein
MKKLLLILLLIAGINCQAQNVIQNKNTILTAKLFKMAFDEIKVLTIKIDSLERRITEFENNCLVVKVDSTVFGYEYRFWEKDSTKMTGKPIYSKQYRIESFK